jgi:hypothetical protein
MPASRRRSGPLRRRRWCISCRIAAKQPRSQAGTSAAIVWLATQPRLPPVNATRADGGTRGRERTGRHPCGSTCRIAAKRLPRAHVATLGRCVAWARWGITYRIAAKRLRDGDDRSRRPRARVATPGRSTAWAARRPVPTSRHRGVPRGSDPRAITCRIAARRHRRPVPTSRRRGAASGTGHRRQHLPDRGQGAPTPATSPRARVATPGRCARDGAASAITCRIAARRLTLTGCGVWLTGCRGCGRRG